MAAVAAFDWAHRLRGWLTEIADEKQEWAGIPMPLDGERLVVEPTYPYADGLMSLGGNTEEEATEAGATKVRNSFWSTRRRSTIVILEENSKIDWGLSPGVHHLSHDIQTLGCSEAWGIEQESAALETLAGLLRHRHFKQYLLTGMFLETSKRSGVTYLFRRLKPTVALSGRSGSMKVLCALCLHPIAYYQGSWAGAMCPTDDVIAHLMLMRGDEPMFWRRANQHPAFKPEAGL